MEERTRLIRRKNDFKKAIRKREIDKAIRFSCCLYYDNLHQYSKNKVHCSCPACSAKTNNKGKNRWAPSYNPKVSQIRIDDSMSAKEFDFFDDDLEIGELVI